ncbi:MAG: AMP-binding protein, partial [Alphaproteobacteria bacterium]|nr:AMP-binding protein [Alphaproteobacteria bacterium]
MTTLQEQLDASQWWPAAVLREQQLAQAAALIRHAAATAPFWRERLEPEGALTMAEFRSLPLLERHDIANAGAAFFSNAVPESHGAMFDIASSGSTGTPVRVRGTGMTQALQQALSLRGYRWHGYDFSAKAAIIRPAIGGGAAPAATTWSPLPGGGPAVWIDTALAFDALLDRLIEEEPEYLTAHPYTLLGLLDESERTGLRPARLQKVRTLGEALEPRIREKARRLWNVPVIDLYGAMEVGFIALQCPESEGLHVMAEGVLLEVVDDAGEPCAPGTVGRVVVTALENYASPLIRYALGDYARAGETCRCGRGLPVIDTVLGRQRNLLVL